MSNPTYANLFENPMGPYSMSSLKAFAIASAGLAVGLLGARILDRIIATRMPADSKSGQKALLPWYGKNAVAAINRRPDAIRIGAQVGGALVSIGGAYMLRHKPVVPWLLGGLALGFGSNALLQLMEWYVLPYIWKIQKADEQTYANRLFVVEQTDTQDKIDALAQDWQNVPDLAQQQSQTPVISGPLNPAGSASLLTVGRPGARNMVGATGRKFIRDGRVGNCATCGGNGGHYEGCDKCEVCGGGGRKCGYTVQPGADVYAIAQAAGINVNDIAALNGGGSPDQWWKVGQEVVMPEAACNVVMRGTPAVPTGPVATPALPMQPAMPVARPATVYGVSGNGAQVNYALLGGE